MTVLRIVLRGRGLRRVVAAFLGFNLADWARWLAILVYAYERGGAAEAGLASLLQLLPASIAAPFISSLGDRYRRDRVLLLAYASQAALMGATGTAMVVGTSAVVVYGFAVLAIIATSLTRPAHASLLPALAATPDELTAANVASSWMEAAGILVGPLVAGFIIEAEGSGVVLLLAAGIMALGAVLVAGVRGVTRADAPVASGAVEELLGGFVALARLPGPRTVVLVLGAAAALWGAIDVLNVALAIDVMGLGASGAGMLGASLGVGGILGSSVAASLVGRPRVARAFVLGLLAWGVPLIGIAIAPVPVVAVLLLVTAGAGRSLMDVAGRLLLQRATPDAVLSRIFGVLEGSYLGAFGLGSVAISAIIASRGPQAALLVAGCWLPLVATLSWRSLRVIDVGIAVPAGRLALLRAVPMFVPLGPAVLERLARDMIPVSVAAGSWVFRQGDVGDRFYVIEAGEVAIVIDDRAVRQEGPGRAFGEIALLRDIPRTASVRALTHVALLALERDDFLEAVTGQLASRQRAEDLVTERLGA